MATMVGAKHLDHRPSYDGGDEWVFLVERKYEHRSVRPGTVKNEDGTLACSQWGYQRGDYVLRFSTLAVAQAYWDWCDEWERQRDAARKVASPRSYSELEKQMAAPEATRWLDV